MPGEDREKGGMLNHSEQRGEGCLTLLEDRPTAAAEAGASPNVHDRVEVVRHEFDAGVELAAIEAVVVAPAGGDAAFLVADQGHEGHVPEPLVDVDRLADLMDEVEAVLGRGIGRLSGVERPGQLDQIVPIVGGGIGLLQVGCVGLECVGAGSEHQAAVYATIVDRVEITAAVERVVYLGQVAVAGLELGIRAVGVNIGTGASIVESIATDLHRLGLHFGRKAGFAVDRHPQHLREAGVGVHGEGRLAAETMISRERHPQVLLRSAAAGVAAIADADVVENLDVRSEPGVVPFGGEHQLVNSVLVDKQRQGIDVFIAVAEFRFVEEDRGRRQIIGIDPDDRTVCDD